MTEEQKEYLQVYDIPYCPSAFEYHCKRNFKKYIGYMGLYQFKLYGWAGSQALEEAMGEFWRKCK